MNRSIARSTTTTTDHFGSGIHMNNALSCSNHAVRQLFEGEVEKTRALLHPCGTRSAAAIYPFRLAGQPKYLTYLIKIDPYAGHMWIRVARQ
jgi:hypothetical protein